MRAIALVAAITMMHTAHASPRPDLAVRQGVNILSNETHMFHHFDRNQRTADRDRERVLQAVNGNEEGSQGAYIVRRVGEIPEGGARVRAVDRRFMRGPDYSEDGGGGGPDDSDSATSTHTTPTQQAAETANSHT